MSRTLAEEAEVHDAFVALLMAAQDVPVSRRSADLQVALDRIYALAEHLPENE